MNPSFQGTLFDGATLAAQPVTVTIAAGRLQVAGPGPAFDVSLGDVQASDRLGRVPRFLYLPEGRSIETADNTAVDALLAGQRRGRLVALVHALETHSRVAAAATLLVVVSVAISLWWGLPLLALRAAQAVPDRIELQVGEAGLLAIDRFLPDSQLDRDSRQRVQTQLDRLTNVAGIKQAPRLVFRSLGAQAPNAFALPGGIIVFSDELVRLADSDEEIAGVLAHEIGHWQRRHGIQGVLRNSAALLVVSTVTGDLSTLTTFAGTIPFTLLQRGYSREFEGEADRYAVELLRKAGIDPEYFASILDKLEKNRSTKGKDFSYLGTHPSTRDRIHVIAPDFVPGRLRKTITAPTGSGQSFAEFKGRAAVSRESVDRIVIDQPVKLGPLDQPPVALVRRPPNYPAEMRKKSIDGEVTVEFIIDRQGNVQTPKIVRSSRAEFEPAAIAAVMEWKFKPGERNGHKVNVRASQKLEFNTTETEPTRPPVADTPAVLEPLPEPTLSP